MGDEQVPEELHDNVSVTTWAKLLDPLSAFTTGAQTQHVADWFWSGVLRD
jgi:hypothetical protein